MSRSAEKLYGKKFRQALRPVLLCLTFALLGGCGTASSPELAPTPVADIDWQMYRAVLQDDGLPLNDKEMAALFSTSELDKDLSISEMAEVQKYFKHYLHKGRPTLERFLYRGQSYIAHTKQVFRERNMPEELAYLAFVESGYNPTAVSKAGAMGLWQFMPRTGRHYNLTQDWWMDERKDPYQATHSAADYLNKLYGDFNNWHLAIAAYNAGEGKIGRALAGSQSESFFELLSKNHLLDNSKQLREETKQYVPRFLAMCKLMRNAEALGIKPAPPIEGKMVQDYRVLEPVASLTVPPGTDLLAFAQSLGMDWQLFSAYNPAFSRYITPNGRYVSVYVPRSLQSLASNIMQNGIPSGAGWNTYTVKNKKVSFKDVGKQTGVAVQTLRQFNHQSEPLKSGTVLRYPGTAGKTSTGYSNQMVAQAAAKAETQTVASATNKSATPKAARPAINTSQATSPKRTPQPAAEAAMAQSSRTAPQMVVQVETREVQNTPTQQASMQGKKAPKVAGQRNHTIKAKETLASLARAYGISFAAIRDANAHLPNIDALKIGQTVVIPGQVTVALTTEYKVQRGDTVWKIARRFNMSPDELMSINNLNSTHIVAGTVLQVAQI